MSVKEKTKKASINFDKPISFGPDVAKNPKAEAEYLKEQLRNQKMRHVAGGGGIGAILGGNFGGLKGAAIGALLGAGGGALTGRSQAHTDKTKKRVKDELASRLKVKFKNKEDFQKWKIMAANSGRTTIRRPDGEDYAFVNMGRGYATIPLKSLAKVQAARGDATALRKLYNESNQDKTKKAWAKLAAKRDPRLERAGVSGFNKPKRTPGHPTKSHIVVAKEGDRVKTIRFGQQGVKTNQTAGQRKAFKSRHAKNISKGRMSAAYWADKAKWSPSKTKDKKNQKWVKGS